MGSRQLTGAALTAKVIKKRLTALYPKVKFSVTSEVFSMGDSVDIRWTDGPMQDMYIYEAIDPSLGCEGAKYVQCHRKISSGHKAMLAAKADEHFGRLNPNDSSYYRRLADIEKMFFPYPETEPKPESGGIVGKADTAIAGLEIKIIKDIDTRDNSEIFVVKIITKVDDFNSLRQAISPLGGYYSRFKRGFIFKEDPTEMLSGQIVAA